MSSTFTFVSPFTPSLATFNNGDTYPDLIFALPDPEKPLRLHRKDLCLASTVMDELFKNQTLSTCMNYDAKTQTLTWTHKGIPSDIVVRWLRFCYGEDQSFSIEECPAALAALIQLQLKTKEDIKSDVEKHMVEVAKKNLEIGAMLLYKCAVEFEECHTDGQSRVDLELTKVVMTLNKKKNYPETVVDQCLLKLPAAYLDLIQFEDAITELGVRLKFVRYNKQQSTDEKKKQLLKFDEMRECCKHGLINGGVFVEEFVEIIKMKDEELALVVKERNEEKSAKEQAQTEREQMMKQRDEEKEEKERVTKELKELKKKVKEWEPWIKEKEEEERRKKQSKWCNYIEMLFG